MTTFDPEATIERAARAQHRSRTDLDNFDRLKTVQRRSWIEDTAATLPIIAADVLAPIESQRAEWVEMMRDPDMTEIERSAVRMCAGELARAIADIKAKAGVR